MDLAFIWVQRHAGIEQKDNNRWFHMQKAAVCGRPEARSDYPLRAVRDA
jgi:hypothetical protein